MEKQTSIKVATTAVNKAKAIKKKTGVSIGKQFEIAFAWYNKTNSTSPAQDPKFRRWDERDNNQIPS